MTQSLIRRDCREVRDVRVEKGAARGREQQPVDRGVVLTDEHCQMAECSESIGRSQPRGPASA